MSLTPGLHHSSPACFSWKFHLAELAVENGAGTGNRNAHERVLNGCSTSLTTQFTQRVWGFYEPF